MTHDCHFCGKTQMEVNVIVKGPKEGICDECIVVCCEVLEEHKQRKYLEFLRET
jgi:ATP-dependent protease Clp ATPase subunit